jgi:hypothetical protein
MRIDASNLLLAAQVQANRPQTPFKAQPAFEPLDFSKPVQGSERKGVAAPAVGARPGSRLDIKV